MPQTKQASGALFRTTHWSVVLAAGEAAEPQAREALEKLCRTYWRPLYAYVRRQGASPHDGQDLVQGFFAGLIELHSLAGVDPSRGRFRSFLLASLKHFLANEHDRTRALKRGGAVSFVPWDEAPAENSFRSARAGTLPPDSAFEKSWALTLLNQVLVDLRDEYARLGKAALFDALEIYLTGEKGEVPYGEMAARLNLGESALKMSIQRLRRRFGELLRAEVAHTVSTPREVDEEIRALFAAVRR